MDKLTGAELVFAERMLPHFLAGKSALEAAQAVLDDDARIFTAFCDRAADQYVPGYNDHTARSYRARECKGDLIAKEITSRVYEQLRA